jgi:hypothetical protein
MVFLRPHIAAESTPIAKLSHECFAHQERGEVRTNRPQVRQRTDHPFGVIRRRHFFQDSVARRFHFVDKLQDEFEPIEQTFDASARHLWNGIAVRLAQRSQLIASITPQGSKSLDAQCRKNAIDLVGDRPSFAG